MDIMQIPILLQYFYNILAYCISKKMYYKCILNFMRYNILVFLGENMMFIEDKSIVAGKDANDGVKMAVLTTEVVSAYVQNNFVPAAEITSLISAVLGTLEHIRWPNAGAKPVAGLLLPAVPVADSVTEEFIVCLEDGKKFKSLKRHLAAKYNMTPKEYRVKWSLSADYPMVAPSYTRRRSQLARDIGLGRKHHQA